MAYGKFKHFSFKQASVQIDRDSVGFKTSDDVVHPWFSSIDVNILSMLLDVDLDEEETDL